MIEMMDLKTQYQTIRTEVLEKVDEIFSSASFIKGKYVQEFEEGFGRLHDGVNTVSCANGTVAIALALEAAGVGPGDEVITTPFTFFATAEATCQVGARPVFVDVDPVTYNIDPKKIEAAITPKTKAILPVHLYGNPCDMDAILEIARKRSLKVIEDCAQAHLARYKGKAVGTFGEAGTFSFYPSKNLGAFGDAGAVVSTSSEMAAKMRCLADHGQTVKYRHDVLGYNYRMAAVQAGILSIKLKRIKGWTDDRKKAAAQYRAFLEDVTDQVTLPVPTAGADHVFHVFTVQVSDRDRVSKSLMEAGIANAIHYPIPLHLQPALGFLGGKKGDFPVAEKLSERVLSLPLYPEITQQQIALVCERLKAALKR